MFSLHKKFLSFLSFSFLLLEQGSENSLYYNYIQRRHMIIITGQIDLWENFLVYLRSIN